MARDQRDRGNSRSTMDYYEYKRMRELRRMQGATNVDTPTTRQQNINRASEPEIEENEPQPSQQKPVGKLLGGIKGVISGVAQRTPEEKYEDEPFSMDESVPEPHQEEMAGERLEEDEQAEAPFASAINVARKLGGGIKNLAGKARAMKQRNDEQDELELLEDAQPEEEAPAQPAVPREHMPYARPVSRDTEQPLPQSEEIPQTPQEEPVDIVPPADIPKGDPEKPAQEPEGVFSLEEEAEEEESPLSRIQESPVMKKIGGFFKFLAKGELEDDESEEEEEEDGEEEEESGQEQAASNAPGRLNRWMEKMKRKGERRAQEEEEDWAEEQPGDQDEEKEFEDLILDEAPSPQADRNLDSLDRGDEGDKREDQPAQAEMPAQPEAAQEAPLQTEPIAQAEPVPAAEAIPETEPLPEAEPAPAEAAARAGGLEEAEEEAASEPIQEPSRAKVYGDEQDLPEQTGFEDAEEEEDDLAVEDDEEEEDEDDEEGEPFNPFGWIKSKLSTAKQKRPASIKTRAKVEDQEDDEGFEDDIDFGLQQPVQAAAQSPAARGNRFVSADGRIQGMEQPEQEKRAPEARQNEGGSQMEDKNKKPSMTELLAADLDDQPVMSRRARRRRADEEEAAQVDLTQPAEETEFPVDEPTVEFKPIRNRADEPAAPKPVPRKKRPPRVVELPEEDDEEEEEIEEVRKPARRPSQPKRAPKPQPQPKKRRVYSDEDYDDEYDDDYDDYDDDDYDDDDYDDDERGGFGKRFLGFLKVVVVIILILALSVLALQQLEANGRVNLDWLRNTVGMVLPVENLFPAPAQPTVVPVEPTPEPAAEAASPAPEVTAAPADQQPAAQQQPTAAPAADPAAQTEGQTTAA